MEIENQILTRDQLDAKLEDDHLKRMIEISRLEGVAGGMLENFVVNPTRAVARLWEFMVYIEYMLHGSVDWSIDFKVEAKGLCSLIWKEVHNKMEQLNQFFKEKE